MICNTEFKFDKESIERQKQISRSRLKSIDLEDGQELRLRPWESVTIPAMTVHRTRAMGQTVNLCFEKLGAETVFVEQPPSADFVPR